MESPNKLSKCAVEPSSFLVGFPFDDIQHGGLLGADDCADTVTGVDSQGIFTRLTPPCTTVNDVLDKYNVNNPYSNLGIVGYSLSNRTLFQITTRNVFRKSFCASISSHGHSFCNVNVSGKCVFIRTISGNGSRSEPLYKTKTGYYEILEVSPTATQVQIKTAYYKQSFIYHPDRNAGSEEATTRFSDISEAYMVLGNKALRKKYDRGLLSQVDLTTAARPFTKDTGSTAKPQPESRRSVVGDEIRGSIFNFDTFYKTHYNEQLQRQRDIRIRKEEMLRRKRETMSQKRLGRMLEMAVGVLLAMGLGIIISLKRG
ncbi:DnaJ -like protein subfamily C member 30 Williams-Beuren syndrome chromosomal region 18 protein [Channa argus]|uniref:DnaJ-like protein subfamily C member 30 Williams-Beuren syndrome chromosomal region 18 protein n=1 Tax=Channa argus TaxID=215402 RepID=A0A6G1QFR6_CHAAH|nr:DnaJ -like protein subfamily C member 30 Williams-Beuren syndrome chromosomal region 18 protein [Channa argus]